MSPPFPRLLARPPPLLAHRSPAPLLIARERPLTAGVLVLIHCER
jgi:hypothetical protein